MTKLKQFLRSVFWMFFQNLFTKLLCLVMAFTLFIYVNTSQNIDREFSLPVSIANRPADLLITSQSASEAKVVVNGPKAKMDQLKADALSLTLAFRPGQGAGEIGFQLYADQVLAPPGIRVRSIEPASVLIHLEPIIARSLPILPDIQGEPKEGYEVTETRVETPIIEVAGPPSILDELEQIKTETIDISGMNSKFKQRVGFRTPNLVSLSEHRSTIVLVNIREKNLERMFERLPIHLTPGAPLRVQPGFASVLLRGPYSAIQTLSAEQLVLGVREDGLIPGETTRRPLLLQGNELLPKVEVQIDPPEVEVQSLAPTPTPTPTLPASPSPTPKPGSRPARPSRTPSAPTPKPG